MKYLPNMEITKEYLPKYADYKDSVVAFIDILGFDNKVRNIKSEDDFNHVGDLLTAIKETAKKFSTMDGAFKNVEITAISDSAIITIPYSDPSCTILMLRLVQSIQYDLLGTEFKTLVRGYINQGRVYHKDGVLFGPGYSDAYDCEKKIGSAPRIVLSPNLVEKGIETVRMEKHLEDKKTIFDVLHKDSSDGFYFVDYLKPHDENKQLLAKERESIRKFITEMLAKYRTNCGVLPKYKWLENYFSLTSKYFE